MWPYSRVKITMKKRKSDMNFYDPLGRYLLNT